MATSGTATLRDVLEELRHTSLDERDKGDEFEQLVRSYLLLARIVTLSA